MKLKTIIERTAARMATVTVDVRSNHGTVCISDDENVHEDIFMQGDDASVFISERDRLWNEIGTIDKGTLELYLAAEYVETLWN